jgi:hypothetical protein
VVQVDNGKLFALFVLIVALFGLYLNAKNQLVPVAAIVIAPNTTKTYSLSQYVLALVLLIALMSVLPGDASLALAGVILLEAFLTNSSSGHNVIKDLSLP